MNESERQAVQRLGAYKDMEDVIVRVMTTKYWKTHGTFASHCMMAQDAYRKKKGLKLLAKAEKEALKQGSQFDVGKFMAREGRRRTFSSKEEEELFERYMVGVGLY